MTTAGRTLRLEVSAAHAYFSRVGGGEKADCRRHRRSAAETAMTETTPPDPTPSEPPTDGPGIRRLERCWARWAMIAFGWANVALGAIGIVLPGLPTTVFLLIALWAFSKSSERFQLWLWTHPRFGPPIRNWHMHQVISRRAKAFAALMMTASFTYVAAFVATDWVLPALLAGVMIPAAAYILTRASRPPVGEEE